MRSFWCTVLFIKDIIDESPSCPEIGISVFEDEQTIEFEIQVNEDNQEQILNLVAYFTGPVEVANVRVQ